MTPALLILLPLSLVLLSVAVITAIWAIRSGQFEDLEAEAERILLDEPEPVRGIDTERRATTGRNAHHPTGDGEAGS